MNAGSHGGTYGANAVACAAAVATQRVIKEEKLVENAVVCPSMACTCWMLPCTAATMLT